MLKPAAGGLTEIPASFVIAQQGETLLPPSTNSSRWSPPTATIIAREAEGAVAASRTTMLGIAIGTVLIGLVIALAFAYSLSRPIFAALQVAERVAAGNFNDHIKYGAATNSAACSSRWPSCRRASRPGPTTIWP